MLDAGQIERRQKVLADFGEFALRSDDLDAVQTEACPLDADALRTARTKVLEIEDEGQTLFVRAGALYYAIFLTDPQDRITNWLPGAEAVYGWTVEEAIGRPGHVLFTPEDQQAGVSEAEVKAAREDGSAPNVRWHLRKDGSRVFIEGSVVALRNEAGGLRGIQKIGQDVTKRHLTEQALRESETQLAAAFESVPTVVAVIDADGKVVIADSQYRQFLLTGIIPSRDPDRRSRWRGWGSQGDLLKPDAYPGLTHCGAKASCLGRRCNTSATTMDLLVAVKS
jgi:PAS domain S-box-containing protein